jgi:undecaprenyl-diphosphatase
LLDQLLQTIILGLIQGVSEWLPISSTAHLKIVGHFFGLTVTPLFNLILHLGTLLVLILFFRKEVKSILVAFVRLDFKSESGKLIPRLIVASIPTAIISITYIVFLRDSLSTLPIIAITFLIGATMVYTTKFAKETNDDLPFKTVVLLGLAQGFAIFPGLSRSGITIAAALLLGQKRKNAFKFSFLLSIPAVIGDFAVEAYSQRDVILTQGIGGFEVAVGIFAAVIAGYFALKLISKVIQGKKLYYFAFYTWALGITLLILTLIFNY